MEQRKEERKNIFAHMCVYIFCLWLLRVTSSETEDGRGRRKENGRERRRWRERGNRDAKTTRPRMTSWTK